jgi:hypothetical protein
MESPILRVHCFPLHQVLVSMSDVTVNHANIKLWLAHGSSLCPSSRWTKTMSTLDSGYLKRALITWDTWLVFDSPTLRVQYRQYHHILVSIFVAAVNSIDVHSDSLMAHLRVSHNGKLCRHPLLTRFTLRGRLYIETQGSSSTCQHKEVVVAMRRMTLISDSPTIISHYFHWHHVLVSLSVMPIDDVHSRLGLP